MVASAQPRRSIPPPAPSPAWASHVVTAEGTRIPRESLERLERLDDTVFAALSGDAGALDAAADAWQEASEAIDPGLLDDTRRHYVRRARSRWQHAQQRPGEQLAVGFAALEILRLLDD